MKYKVKKAAVVTLGDAAPVKVKAGVQEPKDDAERAALEHLLLLNMADVVEEDK